MKLSYKIFAVVFVIIVIIYLIPHKEKRTFDDIKIDYFDRFETVDFGKYEQDNNMDNGPETITWYVLDETKDKVLLITRDTILSIPFHDESKNMNWHDSITRMYLNMIFYKESFTDEEREKILLTNVKNNRINKFGCSSGPDTEDYVFILDNDELEKYFRSDAERMSVGTPYAKNLGLSLVSTMPTADFPIQNAAYYWTRDPGYKQSDSACVNFDGHINIYGFDCNSDGTGARPCMWVKKEIIWNR